MTLQGTLLYMLALLALAVMAVFPGVSLWAARKMGFALASNWFFTLAIAALSFLHLNALISIARVETRSVALTQKVAMLEERLARTLSERERP